MVWLYGSRATDFYSDHSDFDIAIAFKNFQLSSTDRFLRPNELHVVIVKKVGYLVSMSTSA